MRASLRFRVAPLAIAEAAAYPMVLLWSTDCVVEWWFFEAVLFESHLVFCRPTRAGFPMENWSLLRDFLRDCWS